MFEGLRVAGGTALDAQQQADVLFVHPDVERDGADAENHLRQVLVLAGFAELLDLPRQLESREQAGDGCRRDAAHRASGDLREVVEFSGGLGLAGIEVEHLAEGVLRRAGDEVFSVDEAHELPAERIDDTAFPFVGRQAVEPVFLQELLDGRLVGLDPDDDGDAVLLRVDEALEVAAVGDHHPFRAQHVFVLVDFLDRLLHAFLCLVADIGRQGADERSRELLAVVVRLFKVDIRGNDGLLGDLPSFAAARDDEREGGKTCEFKHFLHGRSP